MSWRSVGADPGARPSGANLTDRNQAHRGFTPARASPSRRSCWLIIVSALVNSRT